jgi:Fe-S-cluster containining protein
MAAELSGGLLQLYAELEGPLHQALEGHPISCKPRCTHCCYMMTLCGMQEGLIMANWVMDSLTWKHHVRELRKAAKVMAAAGTTQGDHFRKKKPCVFLNKEDLCDVYDVRPAACRFYYVVSPPEDCAPEMNGKNVLAANTSMQEAMVWKYEIEKSPGIAPPFAPLPLAVLYGCMAVAMKRRDRKRSLFVKSHLSGLPDPITWLESVDIEQMSSNTPETTEAYQQALKRLGITGGIRPEE